MVYLLRISLDIENSRGLSHSSRLKTAIRTIKLLSRKSNKIVILAHRGRPQRREANLSLKNFQPLLSKALKKKVVFFKEFDFKVVKEQISKAPGGTIFLLENLRFLSGEMKNDSHLAKQLAGLGDIYTNDDFPTSHRENSSNVGLSKILPSRLGPNFRKELINLNKIKNPKKPLILIIGGVKIADKISVIKNLLPKAKYILLGGGVANTFLKAEGFDINKSVYDKEFVGLAKRLIRNKKIILPIDCKVSKGQILDIGPRTINYYRKLINQANTVVWNGPMGLFEKSGFAEGSHAIAKTVAESKAFTVVGGGQTGEIITKLKLEEKIGFVSTGGGAMLKYLAGKKLPALKYIKK